MAILKSNNEGVWMEQLPISELQRGILTNGTQEQIQQVIQELVVNPSNEIKQQANQIYNNHKPSALDYEFISCNLTIDEVVYGLINCRINGNHTQIRIKA